MQVGLTPVDVLFSLSLSLSLCCRRQVLDVAPIADTRIGWGDRPSCSVRMDRSS
ncbi:hypothetical protein M406DRAFT_323288 [Cryphonectria parasitica EP155]|uniref:Uncharacterized protein n=1 Tax=Cryphonectria parasitica (strain ATCC 38755 / EP155) TaxID=660469 RepID=A0A9P5CN40_CRYP1|nr:uncharacterized protein M406DRAFT_323288 [Cryphonectria parasitica EP155]KAF3763731.1 hypothetical protein M406DRAFT_323288 [Cryphonectria parasitica EP155]